VTKGPGDYFGELALMYSTPRAATLTALSNAVVWVLDRSTLRQILREVSAAQVEEVMRFLDSVPVLATLSRAERLRLADAMEEVGTHGRAQRVFHHERLGQVAKKLPH
jgi:cGMP-dependent protein kinase 2